MSKRRSRCFPPLAGQNVSIFPFPSLPLQLTLHPTCFTLASLLSSLAPHTATLPSRALRCSCSVAEWLLGRARWQQQSLHATGDDVWIEIFPRQMKCRGTGLPVNTSALFCWDTGISSVWMRTPPLPQPPVFDLARLFVKWSVSDGELEEKFNLAVMLVLPFFFSRCLSRSAVPSVMSECRFCVSAFLKISFSDKS